MTARERLIKTLNHETPDRLCVDMGAGGQTGIGASALHRLNQALLPGYNQNVKIIEPYQMLGGVEEPLRDKLQLDVVGIHGLNTLFGIKNENWKPFRMPDGTEVLVPGEFNYTRDENGAYLIYPEGDLSAPPSAKMPDSGYFFDAITRQESIIEDKLDPQDNASDFGILSEKELDYYARTTRKYYEETDYGIYVTLPGMAFGDVALVPASWRKQTKGIRDIQEWYMSLLMRPDYIYQVFEKQCEIALKNVELMAKAIGHHAQVVFVSGTDFGTQNSLFIDKETYRSLFKPFQKAINDKIHELTDWKIFIHSCGAIYDLIPDLIEAGFDVLNPVQVSANGMDAKSLKQEFGQDLVFWGGGVDTQKTLPFGTPDEIYREVRERIDIFSEGGGFVFNTIHNIQSNVPTENILAMFRAVNDARGINSDF
ncbi:MAG: uroporphyrinogen decarboxylase family protein [Saprospiraceae bacterium]